MSKVTDALERNGPCTADELPHAPNPRDRMKRGVRRMKLTGSNGGGKLILPNGPSTVYYLDDRHAPREVVAAFLDKNPDFLERNNPWTAFKALSRQTSGDAWRQAAREEIEARTGDDVFHGSDGSTGAKSTG